MITWRDLRRWRYKLGWTQKQASDRLMITRSHYAHLELGDHPVTPRIEFIWRQVKKDMLDGTPAPRIRRR